MDPVTELREGLANLGANMFRVRMPVLGELRRYSWSKCRADLVSAATLSLVSIPQAIGFALILGLPPMPVITSVVVGGAVGAFFFSSHHHVFGPTNSISIIVAATLASHAASGLTPLQLAVYLSFLIGVIQLAAGLCNFGELTKFISRSVVIAYSTGIGVLLIVGQLHNGLGMESGSGASFREWLWHAAESVSTGHFNPWALGVALLTLAIFEGVRRIKPSWPEALIGLSVLGIASRLYAAFHGHPPFRLVQDEGALTAAVPMFSGWRFGHQHLQLLPTLVGTAVAVSILGMLEAASITKSLAAKSGQKIEPNQELIGMGAGNIACALFNAVPGSSSFTRSAVNYQSGARSQLASVFSSAIVLAVLFFITPIFNYIPVAALAAHLIRVGVKMINVPQIKIACRATRSDAVVFAATLAASLILKLDTAIYVGIGVSLALFLQKSATPMLVEYTFNEAGNLAELGEGSKRPDPQISIIHVEGELFFGAADLFQDQVRRQAEDENIRVFILRMKNARHLDASTVFALQNLHEYLRTTNRHLLISGCNAEVTSVLRKSGLLAEIGSANIFPAEANPTASTKKALKRANELLPGITDVRIFYEKLQEPGQELPPTYEI
ncbi:MAG TPA: SulP family inorganic anion transporter [Opitutaceae bacterium]|nr:SulP family inorganic anion transporter [Opitutaceae bacterium]